MLKNKPDLRYGFGLQLCRSYAENYLAAFQPHNKKNISRGWSRSGAAATCAAEITSTFFPRDSVFPCSSCQTWTGCSAPCSSLSRGNIRTRINLREMSGRAHLVFMSGLRWFMMSGCLLNIHQLPTLTQGARLSCVRNPQRQKIGPTYFHELCDVNREVPHAAGCLASTELCSLRNFHLMAHFKHLSTTWECCVQRESLRLFENRTQSQGLERLQFTDMPTWDCSEILKGILLRVIFLLSH